MRYFWNSILFLFLATNVFASAIAPGNIEAEDDLIVGNNFIARPSVVTDITAASGITVTNTSMYIQGSGGDIDITADPQIIAGTNGQILIINGQNENQKITLDNGTGVHLHGKAIIGDHDVLGLIYHNEDSQWEEMFRNFPESGKSWSFASPSGSSGTFYVGGYYDFASSDNDFNPAVTHGSANVSYAAHAFIVCAAGGSGGTDTVIRVTGTSINDSGTRATSDTEDLTADDAGLIGAYYETSKKWIGQISIELQSGPDLLCNYGFDKYWDNNNNDFRVVGIEVVGRAGANDSSPNISLIHHKATGWTYNSGSTPTPPTAVANMNTDHNTEIQFVNTENFAWKRDNLSETVLGGNGEGTIIQIDTNANRSVDQSDIILRIRPN